MHNLFAQVHQGSFPAVSAGCPQTETKILLYQVLYLHGKPCNKQNIWGFPHWSRRDFLTSSQPRELKWFCKALSLFLKHSGISHSLWDILINSNKNGAKAVAEEKQEHPRADLKGDVKENEIFFHFPDLGWKTTKRKNTTSNDKHLKAINTKKGEEFWGCARSSKSIE